MLGKKRQRSKQWADPKPKRLNFSGPRQFGAGYNPKQISNRKPPPNQELKWFDTTGGATSWVAAGGGLPSHTAFQSLNLIYAGDNGYNRNGSKIMVKQIHLRATCQLEQNSNTSFTSTTPGDVYFRWMLIIDTQANGSNPAITDIFEENPSGGDSFDIYNSLTETGRFKFLMDKFIKVPQASPMYNTNTQHTHVPNRLVHFKKSFKLDLPIVFSDALANLASVRNNNIFMVVFNGHDGTNCTINYRARIRFSDY